MRPANCIKRELTNLLIYINHKIKVNLLKTRQELRLFRDTYIN